MDPYGQFPEKMTRSMDCVKEQFSIEKNRKREQKQLKIIDTKLFRGTAKSLKTLTFRRNTIVGVFFVYLLRERISNNLITEVTHGQRV